MGDIDDVKKMLKDHEKRISKLESTGVPAVVSRKKQGDRKSIPDLIAEQKQEGFFKEPKLIGEFADKLQQEGHYYSTTSLSGPLQDAVKNRVLGRIKKDGKWAYVNR
jgi:hypothetical protein